MLMDFGRTDLNVRPLRAVDGFAAVLPDENPAEEDRLMEAILERGNMLEALKRVVFCFGRNWTNAGHRLV